MSNEFLGGMAVGAFVILAIMAFVVIGPSAGIYNVEIEGHEALEDLDVCILMDDAIDVGEAIHFATTDGYFIYYDGILYQEMK